MDKPFVALALLGMLLSAYALTLHYDGASDSFCNIGDTFNCDKVNKSPWSELFGIPVALLGALAYTALALLASQERRIRSALAFTRKDYWQYIFLATCTMLAFQAYLTYVEIARIHAYCLICLGSQLTVLTLSALAYRRWRA